MLNNHTLSSNSWRERWYRHTAFCALIFLFCRFEIMSHDTIMCKRQKWKYGFWTGFCSGFWIWAQNVSSCRSSGDIWQRLIIVCILDTCWGSNSIICEYQQRYIVVSWFLHTYAVSIHLTGCTIRTWKMYILSLWYLFVSYCIFQRWADEVVTCDKTHRSGRADEMRSGCDTGMLADGIHAPQGWKNRVKSEIYCHKQMIAERRVTATL